MTTSSDISDRWYPRDPHEPPPYSARSLEWEDEDLGYWEEEDDAEA